MVSCQLSVSNKYTELIAWQKAIDFVESVYNASEQFPKTELYGLTSQARRAAVSVPSNIAEGQSRRGKDFIRHLKIAYGSLSEVETQLVIAQRLNHIGPNQLTDMLARAAEVGRLINGLAAAIERRAKLTTDNRQLTTRS